MKRITFILAALCLIGMTAMAQDNQKGEKRGKMDPEKMITRMDEGISKSVTGLTADQTTKIHALNADFVAGMAKDRPTMKEGERPSQEEMQQMRTKMEESRKAYKTSLKGILSESQYAEYEKFEKSQHQRGGMHGGMRPDRGQHNGAENGASQDAPTD